MSVIAPDARVPEIVHRYVAAKFGDFAARDDQLRELGDVLEQIVSQAERETIGRGAVSLFATLWDGEVDFDGVAIESVLTTDPSFECEGRLWLLGAGGESFSVPLHATFRLSADGGSVSSYEIKIADAVSFGEHVDEVLRKDRDHRHFGSEFDQMRERLAGPKEWVITISKG